MVRLSKSKIGTYKQCPKRYWFEYESGMTFSKPEAMARGIKIHSAIERFYKTRAKNTQDAITGFRKTDFYSEYPKTMENLFFFAEKTSPNILTKPILLEKKMYCEEIDFVGFVDAVFPTANGNILIDFKSGKVHDIEGYRFELAMYTYLAEKVEQIKIDYWGIVFVDHQNEVKIESINQDVIFQSLREIKTVRNLIQQKHFVKRPSWKCKWCPAFTDGKCDGKKRFNK